MSSRCARRGCHESPLARGLCGKHYREDRAMRRLSVPCSIPECDRPEFCRGLCRGHYARAMAGKDVSGTLAPHAKGNSVLAVRVPRVVLEALRAMALREQATPNQIAARLLAEGSVQLKKT